MVSQFGYNLDMRGCFVFVRNAGASDILLETVPSLKSMFKLPLTYIRMKFVDAIGALVWSIILTRFLSRRPLLFLIQSQGELLDFLIVTSLWMVLFIVFMIII